MNVHAITNRLARNLLTFQQRNELARKMSVQMNDGYRLAFPVLLVPGNRVLCIALIVPANDGRSASLFNIFRGKPIKPRDNTDHVFVFMCYEREAEWLEQATKVKDIFPEQPEAEESQIELESEQEGASSTASTATGTASVEAMRKATIDCYEDAVGAGLVDPAVCCLDTNVDLAKALALRHVSALLPQLKAKFIDSKTGMLRPVEPVNFDGGIVLQAWPLRLLTQELGNFGSPSHWLNPFVQQLTQLPKNHFWLISFSSQGCNLAPMPKPIK